MLIDELLTDGNIDPDIDDFSIVRDRIALSQKFVLDNDFAMIADELQREHTQVARILPFARVPYASCWIEFSHAGRPSFCKGEIDRDKERKPKRVGFFVEAQNAEMTVWKAHLFWSFNPPDDDYVRMSFIAGLFDIDGDNAAAEQARRGFSSNGCDNVLPEALVRSFCTMRADCGEKFMLKMARLRGNSLSWLETIFSNDWRGEGRFLLATLALLNTKNIADVSVVDRKDLNRARQRRCKPPLNSFHICRIKRHHKIAAKTEGPGDESFRAHFVRGHFKVRATGVFWWSPHVRGDLSQGFVEKDYLVEA